MTDILRSRARADPGRSGTTQQVQVAPLQPRAQAAAPRDACHSTASGATPRTWEAAAPATAKLKPRDVCQASGSGARPKAGCQPYAGGPLEEKAAATTALGRNEERPRSGSRILTHSALSHDKTTHLQQISDMQTWQWPSPASNAALTITGGR